MAVQTVQQQPRRNSNNKKENKSKKQSITSNGSDVAVAPSRKDVTVQVEENWKLAEEHLPPLPLVFTVIICSGLLFVLGFRDVFATGKTMFGSMDAAMLEFTKSKMFFTDMKGWKSTQGGLSTIQHFTTDQNNMGGLMIRKLCGVVMMGVHGQKLFPLLFHPRGAQWNKQHFRPILSLGLFGNLCNMGLFALYYPLLVLAGTSPFPQILLGILVLESIVLFYYYATSTFFNKNKNNKKTVVSKITQGKTPYSVPSRIVSRTVGIVSMAMTIIAGRDLFFPGTILDFVPRDDIYLEWTNALLHSPPIDSPEYETMGMEAPLYMGDKFVSQLFALNLLVVCLYKFMTAFFIPLGNDGVSGQIQCRMIWKVQAITNGLILLLLRLFTPAAKTASLDLRWHLMCVAYETFILGIYGFF